MLTSGPMIAQDSHQFRINHLRSLPMQEAEAEGKKGLKSQNQEEAAPAVKEGSAKPQRKPAAKEEGGESAAPPARGGPRGRGRGGPRGGSARGGRGNQENFPPPAEGGEAAAGAPAAGGEGAAEGGRGRGRGRGEFRGRGGRGGGRGRGFAGGNRDFDRQSADPKSSVKPTEKREGGGRGNWGTDKVSAFVSHVFA